MKIEIKKEGVKPFYSIRINDIHIWRFDFESSALIMKENLERALCLEK